MTNERMKERYSPPSRTRRIIGWMAVIAGIAMVVLPGPGLLTIVFGMIMLGRNEPTLRRWSLALRVMLRRMAHSKQQTVRTCGLFLRERHRQSRMFVREELHRHASGKPFSAGVQVMIGFALLMTLISLSAGAAVFING